MIFFNLCAIEGFTQDTCNLTDHVCFSTEVCKKRCFLFQKRVTVPLPTQYNVGNQKKKQVVLNNVGKRGVGVGGCWQVRPVKLARVLRVRESAKFVPKSFISDGYNAETTRSHSGLGLVITLPKVRNNTKIYCLPISRKFETIGDKMLN